MSAPVPDRRARREPGHEKKRWWSFGGNFAWAASLFLTGLGAKLALILEHGSAFPYWDQWPGEAIETFVPWFNHTFSLARLFQAHNEHRIVFTRLLELSLVLLNGQWDSLLEMACNAVIQCATIAGLGWVMASVLGKRSWPLVWLLLALQLALPFAWENTLWGFQSQFYFLVFFSWLTVWLLGLNQPWSPRWWFGAVAAIAALFTVASGFLAAAAAAVLVGLSALKRRQEWRRFLPTWIVCAMVIALGLAFKFSVPADHATQARSAGDFALALGKSLAWPWATHAWYAPLGLLPLLLLGWICLRSPEVPTPAVLLIFGMGGWAVLQALAMAYARGIGGGAPAWRYMDALSFIPIAGALGIYVLFTQYRARLRFVPLLRVILLCWALACFAGLGYLTRHVVVKSLPEMAAEQAAQSKSARAFLATDDPRAFSTVPDGDRPVPNVDADIWLLRNLVVRDLLPACARVPLRLTPGTNDGDAFIPHGWLLNAADDPTETSWGSWSAQKAAARGKFESLPVKPGALPYLEIPVAGDLGKPGLTLQLIELENGRVTDIVPPRPPGGEWLNVHVPAPAGEFKLVARDDSDTGWFAFKEPREIGRLSVWTLRFLSAWKYVLVLGLGAFALNLNRWWHNSIGRSGSSATPPA